MPTDTSSGRTAAAKFALRTVAWSVALFGVSRVSWVEAHALLPFTQMQARLAARLLGAPTLPIEATLACSGADALTLCLGAVLAYPVSWRRRFAGAVGGLGLILAVNTIRIGTLGRAAATPAWFNTLHVYIWPAVLTLAIAGYVFAWMRLADHQPSRVRDSANPAASPLTEAPAPQPTRRFVLLTATFLLLFLAASPFYLESTAVLAVASFIARATAATLTLAGISTHATANVLWTSRGGFVVTQECISTPLIPVYLAGVCAYSPTWRRAAVGLLAVVPLFIVLGIARLWIVALPNAVIASPLFLIHAFYQLLLGAVVVLIAAAWRHGRKTAALHAIYGVIAGVAFVGLFGPLLTRVVTYPAGAVIDDPQGAVAFLPAFQWGLFLALWIAAFITAGWKRFVAGFAVLGLTQVGSLFVLQAVALQSGAAAQVRDIRGWAVVAPLLIVATVVNVAREPR